MRALALLSLPLALAAACNGGDGECGPGDAPPDGVSVTTDRGALAYGGFRSSVNNDCTPPGASVISVTIDGTQVTDAGAFFLTLCVPRPDRVGSAPLALGLTDQDPVRLVDVNGTVDGCTFSLDRETAPDATITFRGFCGDGSDPAGYAIELSGDVSLELTCGVDPPAPLAGALSGRAAVDAL